MALLITVFVVFVLLCLGEIWWRKKKVHGEVSRKFIHITVGSFVAFWPFFLSWNQIKLLSLAFLIVVAISRYLRIFQAIHSVNRPTWGELYFAVAVGGVAFMTHNKWIYMVALLQMSLADGLAAIIGVRYGKHQRYSILGQVKSVIGTATFVIVSFCLLVAYRFLGQASLGVLAMLGLALAAGLIENIGVFGLDNLFVPLLIAAALRLMS